MIYFIFGEDSYRVKRKLDEIIEAHRKIYKSGLNLIFFDAKEDNFDIFFNKFFTVSMFKEKKLGILKKFFSSPEFQSAFFQKIKDIKESENILIIYQPSKVEEKVKAVEVLKKNSKFQKFDLLTPLLLRRWVIEEFNKRNKKITFDACILLLQYTGNDLWRLENEIEKLSNYKKEELVKREDVELLVSKNIETDIFKTIDAIASGDKRRAFYFLQRHLENSENPSYLLSMIAFQFRNLLVVKELQEEKTPFSLILSRTGLKPFVARKICSFCSRFSFEDLKNIYRLIFQADLDIKTGKIEPEVGLNFLVSEI